MKRISGLTLSGMLLTGAFAFGQAPIVRVEAPLGVTARAQAPAALPIPVPMPPPTAAPVVPAAPNEAFATTDPTANDPKGEEPTADKFFLQKLLESSPAGQTLAGNGWEISGWTQGSFTTGSVRNTTLPVPFIDRVDEFSLNQNWLHVHKTVDTSKKEFQIGGAADMILPGTDHRFTAARGLLSARQRRGDAYGVDLFQAYADFFLPGVGSQGSTLRVGKFATLVGYETVQAITTPFVSRSYSFQYNPFTHTGAQLITPLNDDWTMTNGIVQGSDNFFSNVQRTTYIGQLKWAPKDGPTTVALNAVITDPSFDAERNFAFYNVYNAVITRKINDKLTYAADATYSHMDNVPGVGFANWYGLSNYLLRDVNDKLQAKLRVELFNDEQGIRTGFNGLYTGVTAGLTWKPTPWLYVMPEVRYDYNAGTSNPGPFEGQRDLFAATIGAIVRW